MLDYVDMWVVNHIMKCQSFGAHSLIFMRKNINVKISENENYETLTGTHIITGYHLCKQYVCVRTFALLQLSKFPIIIAIYGIIN